MTRVKICGITSAGDAAAAVEAGADALGFVFVPGTPRWVCPDVAERIVKELPPFITTVGVFVDQSLEDIRGIVAQCPLRVVQLHGDEPEDFGRQMPCPVIKAIRVRSPRDLRIIETYPAHAFLLDAFVEGGGGAPVLPSAGIWPGRPKAGYPSFSPAASGRRQWPRPFVWSGPTAWMSAAGWRGARAARITRK